MLLKWLIISAAVFNFAPVYVYSHDVSRIKRSQDYIPCDKGWFSFGEKCYRVGTHTVTWKDASERCTKAGGHLVTIQSKEENDFLVAFLQLDVKSTMWIGLHDRVNESEYFWHDGSAVNFTYWKDGEPSRHAPGSSDDKEDCVEMSFDLSQDVIGTWNDNNCESHFPYICQTKINRRKKSPNPQYCSSSAGGGWKYQKSCYHIVTEMKTWNQAEQHCKDSFKGHLVTILDTSVDYFLNHILSHMSKELWIGIKIKDQFQQKWTSGWHVSYNGMDKDHGDFIEGTCVLRNKRKVWTMVPCSKKYSFICEISTVIPPVLKLPMKGSHCPDAPDDWRDLDGEFCYFIETEKHVTWYEANFDCRRRGGNLLSLHSKEETEILDRFVRYTQRSLYIGLLRPLAHEVDFVWSDDSPMDYENWDGNEPNSDEEKCGEFRTYNMKWNDLNCEDTRGYVCSVRKITPNKTVETYQCAVTTLNTTIVEQTECTGSISLKALIGVVVCIILVLILLGIVIYYFKPWDVERRKRSISVPNLQQSPSNNRPKYRSQTELTVKDEDSNCYESMY